MENYIIEVSGEDGTDIAADDHKLVIKLSDYKDLIKLLGKANLLDGLQEKITFQCDHCKSFVLSTKELHIIIKKVIDYLDDNSSDSWIDLYNCLGEIRDGLQQVIYLTDKEWNDYYTIGLPDINFIYEKDGKFMEGPDGHPLKYVTDEVAFKLKSQCECTHVLERI